MTISAINGQNDNHNTYKSTSNSDRLFAVKQTQLLNVAGEFEVPHLFYLQLVLQSPTSPKWSSFGHKWAKYHIALLERCLA